MRAVRYCVATSLDGYIAGPGGEFDWIIADPDIDFRALFGEFDTLLMGRKTYQVTREQPSSIMLGKEIYVFSKTLEQADCPGTTLADDPIATTRMLKQAPGRDIWLFGGGLLFGFLLEAGLVDTVEVTIVPILLGSGLPLLSHPASYAALKLIENRTYEKTGSVSLRYSIV